MDVFSAGCVIAEMFLEGAPLFSLSQLFKYREGEYSVDQQLATIDDQGIRVSVSQPLQHPNLTLIDHDTTNDIPRPVFSSHI